jgi:hypothetical protein
MLNITKEQTKVKKQAGPIRSFFELGAAAQQFSTSVHLLDEGHIILSPHEAALLLAETRYERQTRDLTAAGSDHIAVLADIMSRGKWRRREKLDFARLHGRLILVNGHHRLGAQVQAGVPLEWTVVIHECGTEDEVADLYASFDTNVRARGVGTILDVSGQADKLDLTKSTATALYRAVPLIAMNFSFSIKDRSPVAHRVIDRRFAIMSAFKKEAKAWETATKAAPTLVKKRLSTQGALAVALMTFRHQPQSAAEFWGGVAENDGLRKGDPRHSYLAVLTGPSGMKDGSAATTAGYAAAGWNAFFEGRQNNYLKLTGAAFRIAGTHVGRK